MFRKRKPKVGYQKDIKKTKKTKKSAIHLLFVSPKKKISMIEKFIKLIIYVALRLVIRPRKWKDPRKNIEIINRTYKRIMSADFVFIPSSIAFYLIMAFLPVLSLISLIYLIPGVGDFFSSHRIGTHGKNTGDAVSDVLGKFIPGAQSIFTDVRKVMSGGTSAGASVAVISSLLVSTWIAANGFSKLIYTQSYIYGHKYLGGYWMNKLKGMFMVLAFTFFLMLSLVVNVSFTIWISSMGIDTTYKHVIVYSFSIFTMFFGLFVGFIILYKYSPRFKIRIRDVVPGAMITTIPTAGFILLFGTITQVWTYGIYGVIGAIMFIGMASLIVTYFIFVGITANAAYYKTFVGDKVKTKWTLSKK